MNEYILSVDPRHQIRTAFKYAKMESDDEHEHEHEHVHCIYSTYMTSIGKHKNKIGCKGTHTHQQGTRIGNGRTNAIGI